MCRDWRNTPDGQRVYVGKYWTSTPEAMAEAGRALVRRLVGVIQRHPVLASADVVVAVPVMTERISVSASGSGPASAALLGCPSFG